MYQTPSTSIVSCFQNKLILDDFKLFWIIILIENNHSKKIGTNKGFDDGFYYKI